MQSVGKSAPSGCKIMRGVYMNYYNEIKEKLIESEIYNRAKDY